MARPGSHRRRAGPSGRERTGRRWAAVALAVLGAGACSGSGTSPAAETVPPAPATGAPTTTTPVPDAAGRIVDVYVPAVGDCFDVRVRADGRGHESTYHLLLDCALPHAREVFAVVGYPDGAAAAHPGEDALRRFARLECPRRFGDYVGAPYELSRYGLVFELPDPDQWLAWPAVGCVLTDPDAGLTTGSGRATYQ